MQAKNALDKKLKPGASQLNSSPLSKKITRYLLK